MRLSTLWLKAECSVFRTVDNCLANQIIRVSCIRYDFDRSNICTTLAFFWAKFRSKHINGILHVEAHPSSATSYCRTSSNNYTVGQYSCWKMLFLLVNFDSFLKIKCPRSDWMLFAPLLNRKARVYQCSPLAFHCSVQNFAQAFAMQQSQSQVTVGTLG